MSSYQMSENKISNAINSAQTFLVGFVNPNSRRSSLNSYPNPCNRARGHDANDHHDEGHKAGLDAEEPGLEFRVSADGLHLRHCYCANVTVLID